MIISTLVLALLVLPVVINFPCCNRAEAAKSKCIASLNVKKHRLC